MNDETPALHVAADRMQELTFHQPPPNIIINGADGTPLVTIHPNGVLDYGPGYSPDKAARAFWDALRHLAPANELARFFEGEEPYTDERIVPTPAQWIWKWNRATPARRLQVAEAVLRANEDAHRCAMECHLSVVEELREARAAIHRVRQVHRPVEYRGRTICAACSSYYDDSCENGPCAIEDCPTLKAIGGGEQP